MPNPLLSYRYGVIIERSRFRIRYFDTRHEAVGYAAVNERKRDIEHSVEPEAYVDPDI